MSIERHGTGARRFDRFLRKYECFIDSVFYPALMGAIGTAAIIVLVKSLVD